MIQAKNGDTVKVHYTGKHTNGEIFDSSLNREPLEFALGAGQMIAGFENAVLGMKIGENKTVNIPSQDGYGDADENLIFSVALDSIPKEIPLSIGLMLNAQADNGRPIQVMVKEITPTEVVLDANHPLAGYNLVFDIELLDIIASQEV